MTLDIKRVKTPEGVGYAIVSGTAQLTKAMSWDDALAEWQRKKREKACHSH
ncbi:MAG: hypothetical protein GY851_02170 [bacterium]|nr:hypothetical protein [bacterium]